MPLDQGTWGFTVLDAWNRDVTTTDGDKIRGLDLVALLGASESEVVVLAELHRNPRVHIVGVYDPSADAVGHELSEILGLRHGSDDEFLEQIASSPLVVLPRDRHRYAGAIEALRERGCGFIDQDAALARFAVQRRVEHPPPIEVPYVANSGVTQLEESLGWLEKALDRESLLRSLLSIAVQAVSAEKGSIQLFDPFTQQLFIAYADGLSDHTVRSARQCLGEGIAGRVAQTRRGELLQGGDLGPARRDRPDIQSAICAPLVDGGELLGVVNVSTDHGSRVLTQADLERLMRMASRIAPVLRRLMQIQGLLDRSLVEDLERELDGLLDLDPPVVEALAISRDLVQDLSGAHEVTLIVLGEDGPAFQLHPGRDSDGAPITSRRLDASRGILGQVLLDGNPVMLEEKNRRAGESRIRREMTSYLPLGSPEPFAVLISKFHGLSTLTHFQRNLDRLREVLTARLAALLARQEARHRHDRLRRLATGLSQLVQTPAEEQLGRAATLFMELTGAEAVAIWKAGSSEPDTELRQTMISATGLEAAWARIRERLRRSGGACRIREIEPAGSDLRSVLTVGSGDGPAIAALNRRPEDPLAEWGFRDEDVENATLLLDAVGAVEDTLDRPAGSERAEAPLEPGARSDDPAMAERLLKEAVARELHRAQRYHLGFSLSVFRIDVESEVFSKVESDLQRAVEESSRSTDAVLWLSDQRLAILAPEEMRGQRRLVRRVEDLISVRLIRELGPGDKRVIIRSAAYPRDVHSAEQLIERCLDPTESSSGGD